MLYAVQEGKKACFYHEEGFTAMKWSGGGGVWTHDIVNTKRTLGEHGYGRSVSNQIILMSVNKILHI